jgi:hypothetical protein
MVVMSPLNRLERIESRWLYKSVLDYMRTQNFAPQTHLTLDELAKLLNAKTATAEINSLNNISY